MPIDTIKSVNTDDTVEKGSNGQILVSGWASTGDRDFQGETVEPIGIDATYLFNNGWIDYEHDTNKVIGAPTSNSYVDTDKGLQFAKVYNFVNKDIGKDRMFDFPARFFGIALAQQRL